MIEQVSREVNPPRAGDPYRRRSQVLEEKSAEVTGTEADGARECIDIANVKGTLGNQFERARDDR